jgi:hypothetical protein
MEEAAKSKLPEDAKKYIVVLKGRLKQSQDEKAHLGMCTLF